MSSSHVVSHPLDDLPVKYVLYTHYAHPIQQQDYKSWEKAGGSVDIHTLDSYKYLVDHLRGLQELLDTSPQEGLLVIFYDPGFAECLEGIAEKKTREALQSECKKLQFAEMFRAAIDREMQKYGRLSKRVRFVTPLDLCDIFGRMDWTKAEKLRWWFIGPTTSIRYDTPKIVEAIVRVRLIGSGVPLFRIDWDVIFRGKENKDIESLGLFKVVTQCLQAFRLRRDDARLATFLFSGCYNVRDVCDPERKKTFDAWRGAYATRIFPAIGVDKDLALKAQNNSVGDKESWDKYACECFNEALARRFYGLVLTDHGMKIAPDYRNSICYFGANPLVSVISGALLCLSDSAIVELPPFSNFGLNVSWIDDHLKYCLHRELRHLTTVTLAEEPLLSDAKIDCIMVNKWRAPVTNLPFYTLGVYLPTVLWGTVMDSWITADPILKFRPESLSEAQRQKWNDAGRTGPSTAVLTGALQAAIQRATPSSTERFRLKERLMDAALRRITMVRKAWAHLKNKKMETFASVWVTGTVKEHFPPNDFPELNGRCLGLVAHKDVPVDVKFTRENMPEYINPWIQNDLHQLVDDVYEYIEWTLAWPVITQVIRSVEPGKLRTDLSWPRL